MIDDSQRHRESVQAGGRPAVGVVLCGGNIDLTSFFEMMEQQQPG